MPLRLFPFAFALVLGAVYLLGGFDRDGESIVGLHEMRYAVEDAVVYSLSDAHMHAVEDFIVGLADPFESIVDVPHP